MCGVFGYVANSGQKVDMMRLIELATVTEARGPHAFGLAWITPDGRIHAFKKAGRITDHLGVLTLAADAVAIIGHCRYATAGDPHENINNHPHPSDGGWIVHNGTLEDYEATINKRGLHPSSDCDSELLALLIEESEKETMAARCVDAARAAGSRPLVLLGLWKPGELVAVRRGNPLHLGSDKTGVYLASLPDGLPKNAQRVPDWTVLHLSWNETGRPARKQQQIRGRTESRKVPAPARTAGRAEGGWPQMGDRITMRPVASDELWVVTGDERGAA